MAKLPKLYIDNPGGDWLQRKLETAQEDYRTAPLGSSRRNYGSSDVTGYFKTALDLPPDLLKDLPGALGEEAWREDSVKLENLEKRIREQGYEPSPILINVREDGQPFIVEGNHRVVEALKSGRTSIPVDLRYLRGAEDVKGPLSIDRLREVYEPPPKDQPRAPLLLEGPSEDRTGKEPSKGRMFRGIGSLMRGRNILSLLQGLREGYELLPEEYQVLDEAWQYLKGTEFNPFDIDKPGIESFKELLGISPEKIDAYHGTTAEFDAFEFLHGSGGDLGFHFGTSKQAKDRLKETTQYSPPEKRAKGKILSAELTLGKTLETPDMPSFEEWNSPRSVAKLLLGTRWGKTRQKELSSIVSEANALNQKIDDIFEAEDESLLALDFWENLREMDVKGRMGLLSKVRDLMKADGYEGIKYVNEYEDPESRSYSYVVFDPANIRIKDEGETIQLPGPPQSKAAGGFIDKPLYDDQRMIGAF